MSKKQNRAILKRALRRKENRLRELAPTHDIMRGRVAKRNWGTGMPCGI